MEKVMGITLSISYIFQTVFLCTIFFLIFTTNNLMFYSQNISKVKQKINAK